MLSRLDSSINPLKRYDVMTSWQRSFWQCSDPSNAVPEWQARSVERGQGIVGGLFTQGVCSMANLPMYYSSPYPLSTVSAIQVTGLPIALSTKSLSFLRRSSRNSSKAS